MNASTSFQLKQLDSRVKSVWRRSQFLHLTAGLLAFCRWAVPLFLIGMAVDWLTYMPAVGRVAILMTLLSISLYQAWRCGWRHFRWFNATHTALLLEKSHGGMESLLVSAVQLRDPQSGGGASNAMREKTCRMAEEAVTSLHPNKTVPFKRLRYPALIALALALLMGACAVVNGPFLVAGVTRIFTPWVTIPYPTKTKLHFGKGDLVVKEGDSAEIVVGVSGVVPQQARLFLRTGEGRPREMQLDVTDGSCQYQLASASRDFSYRIMAGDARSDWHNVRVITSPRIEHVKVDLEFPAYLQRDTETLEALTLTVPEDTNVHWQLTVDRPIRSAVLHRDGEEPLPLTIGDDGRQLMINERVDASRGYHFSWVEQEHGFDFASPRYYLQVASDQPPRVEITSPETNLNALLGRQLDLAVRTSDDHGIGAASIIYRVNLLAEKTVPLVIPVASDNGDQRLDWDYRTELPELKIGDTVSLVVEVADNYPAPDGPHQARSDTRRITFLSREEYLAQIEKKKDRLLSQVRTTYRQQRAAHELVRKLNPQDPSFLQTCQLEAVRQEMLRQQLNDIARQVQALLDDLKANQIIDAVEGDALVQVRTGLQSIAENLIAKAASLLREQAGVAANASAKMTGPNSADQVINQAARELGGIVLQQGIDSAREVFARESHMLALEQAALQLLANRSTASEAKSTLSKRQQELALWTDQLIDSLQQGMRYDKRPVSVLSLTRRSKDLRASGATEKMQQAAALTLDGKPSEAAVLQKQIIAPLLDAEFSMRTGAQYASMMKFRSQLDSLLKTQRELRKTCQALDADAFEKSQIELATTQAKIQEQTIESLLPPIPVTRARLFDNTLPKAPPIGDARTAAESSIKIALVELDAGQQQPAILHQLEAEQKLSALAELLEPSTVELGLRTQGLGSLVSVAVQRTTQIENYEARQIGLLEQTEEAALDKAKSDLLAEPQQFLADEIADFRRELMGKDEASTDQDVLPLLSRLDQVAGVLKQAITALRENRPEDALEYQEKAAGVLADARELVLAQVARLTLLQEMYAFERAVGKAHDWMADIVAEQSELVANTKTAKSADFATLVPVMKNLRQCLTDIAPVLDLVAGRLDAGTPLAFAGADLEDAVFAIEDNDLEEAIDAQQVATESLAKVQTLVKAVQVETGYLAEIVDFLHHAQADAALLTFKQEQLTGQLAAETGELPAALSEDQFALQAEVTKFGRTLEQATGMATFNLAGQQIQQAVERLKAGDATGSFQQMEEAQTTLTNNAEEMFLVISMLHGLPSIEVLSTTSQELVLLIDVLAVAAKQRQLSRQTETAAADFLAELAGEQQELEKSLAKLLPTDSPQAMLATAQQHLTAAASALQSPDQITARQHQESADQALRHFIIEQALILETRVVATASSNEPVLNELETTDLHESTANFVSDFVSGELPEDQRTEWEVLGNRNRAALNQNFARELPLEYRGTLKNYYERVAK